MHHSHTKRLPPNLGPFVVVPLDGDFAWEVLKKWASSALRKMTSFFPGAQTSDPCRGFEPSPQRLRSAPFLAMPLDGDFAWEVLEKWAYAQKLIYIGSATPSFSLSATCSFSALYYIPFFRTPPTPNAHFCSNLPPDIKKAWEVSKKGPREVPPPTSGPKRAQMSPGATIF